MSLGMQRIAGKSVKNTPFELSTLLAKMSFSCKVQKGRSLRAMSVYEFS